MRHSSMSVGTKPAGGGSTGYKHHHSWHWAACSAHQTQLQGLASLTQHTRELFVLKGETAVQLLQWCRADPSCQGKEELMVLPLASQHVPEITATTLPDFTIMLNIPQGRQGSKSDLEGGYSSLTCAVPFLSIQSKAIATETSEAANGVSTRPVSAQAREDFTFVHICG